MMTMVITPFIRWLRQHRSGRLALGAMLGALLLLPVVLVACDTPPPTSTPLNQLHWCDKQTLLFQDASQSPPVTLTNWNQVKKALNFTVYLPQSLPVGSCLVSGEALIHDKVLGSSFGVSYLLPGGVSLAFSETAMSGGETASFQCSPSNAPQPTVTSTGTPTTTPTPTPTPTSTVTSTVTPEPTATPTVTLLCLGGKGSTNIVLDSSGSESSLQTLFKGLQPNVDWIPQK
jgi:hypothetical protein